METQTDVKVVYVHRYEYQTQDRDGRWSEPETRYHNPTTSERVSVRRHQECRDLKHEFGHKFEGIYGYAWKNCRVVKRTTTITVEEEEL